MLTGSIVTYNNKTDTLLRTIESFLEATDNSKLYLIDNSSHDFARSLATSPAVEYIYNSSNVGYGRAHNMALRKVLETSKYHLILNPDVSFSKNVVQELVDFMDANPGVGLTMPKVLYPDGRLQPLCKLLPLPHQLMARRFLRRYQKIQEVINHTYEMRFSGYNAITEVPFLSGCFMLIRTEVLKKVGLFDERFFLYFEDTDLSRRIHEHCKTVFYPNVQIYHVHERGHSKDRSVFRHGIKSAIQYFNKWGWLFDKRRDFINRDVRAKYRLNGHSWNLKNGGHS